MQNHWNYTILICGLSPETAWNWQKWKLQARLRKAVMRDRGCSQAWSNPKKHPLGMRIFVGWARISQAPRLCQVIQAMCTLALPNSSLNHLPWFQDARKASWKVEPDISPPTGPSSQSQVWATSKGVVTCISGCPWHLNWGQVRSSPLTHHWALRAWAVTTKPRSHGISVSNSHLCQDQNVTRKPAWGRRG